MVQERLENVLLLSVVLVIFMGSKVVAESEPTLKACHNTGTQTFCHKNRFNCDDPTVKWSCQRTCDVKISGPRQLDAHPWHVSLLKPGEKEPFCAGTLISDVHVLTAAHCTIDKNPEDFVAIIGDHDWTSSSTKDNYAVECIQNHYLYDSNLMDHDIALITLKDKVDFGPDAQPACLPRSTNFKDRGLKKHEFTVSGWGAKRTQEGHPIALHSVDLDYVKWHQCRRMYKWNEKKISWRTFCSADGDNEDVCACAGDGGAPFVERNDPKGRVTALGIVSWGLGCHEKSKSGVYTDIRMLMDWINRQLEKKSC